MVRQLARWLLNLPLPFLVTLIATVFSLALVMVANHENTENGPIEIVLTTLYDWYLLHCLLVLTIISSAKEGRRLFDTAQHGIVEEVDLRPHVLLPMVCTLVCLKFIFGGDSWPHDLLIFALLGYPAILALCQLAIALGSLAAALTAGLFLLISLVWRR